MSHTCTFLNQELYDYMLQKSLRSSPIVEKLYEHTKSLPQGHMQTSLEQVQLMQLLLKLTGAKRIIEVGVFTGLATLAMAMALPSDGTIVACDISKEWTEHGKTFWNEANVADKIELILQPAQQTLQNLLDKGAAQSFDFAYIDADKSGYCDYYELCLKLIKSNGLILIDNTFMHNNVVDNNTENKSARAIQRFNDYVKDDERIDLTMLPIGDGLSILRKR